MRVPGCGSVGSSSSAASSGQGRSWQRFDVEVKLRVWRQRSNLPGWSPAGQLLDAMGGAAVFAMPSRVAAGGDRDGIPNVVLEAMAAGLPVVATAVSGIPEAVSHETTGLLVEPGDVTGLAEALERVLTDSTLAARFGAAGRARIAEEFTLEVASSRLLALFHDGKTPDLR